MVDNGVLRLNETQQVNIIHNKDLGVNLTVVDDPRDFPPDARRLGCYHTRSLSHAFLFIFVPQPSHSFIVIGRGVTHPKLWTGLRVVGIMFMMIGSLAHRPFFCITRHTILEINDVGVMNIY